MALRWTGAFIGAVCFGLSPDSRASSFAQADADISLWVEYSGPTSVLTMPGLSGGTRLEDGFGWYDASAAEFPVVLPTLWTQNWIASASASAVSPPVASLAQASYHARSGTIMTLFNDPAKNLGSLPVSLTFAVSAAFATSVIGDGYAFAGGDFRYSVSGIPLSIANCPRQPFAVNSPPSNPILTCDWEETYHFVLNPGSRQTVSLDYGYVSAFAYAEIPVPEPASWSMMIAGFGMLGAMWRKAQVPKEKGRPRRTAPFRVRQ